MLSLRSVLFTVALTSGNRLSMKFWDLIAARTAALQGQLSVKGDSEQSSIMDPFDRNSLKNRLATGVLKKEWINSIVCKDLCLKVAKTQP